MRLVACGLLIGLCVGPVAAETPPAHFDRGTFAVESRAHQSGPGAGMVTRESIAIAACRAAAAPYGKLVGNDLRLIDRHTFLISGQIVPASNSAGREAPVAIRKQQRFECKVTDTGKVVAQGFGSLPARDLRARPQN
jgi:hypothetical protein